MTLDTALLFLPRTPPMLRALLAGLPPAWAHVNEGGDTWSAYDVVGHLVDGERHDWMVRARIILEGGDRAFVSLDRFAHLRETPRPTLDERLETFATLRMENLAALAALELSPRNLERTGRHPEFGEVTLGQLLATWVAHDLDHLSQIARVLAKPLANDVGPWRAYLRVVGG